MIPYVSDTTPMSGHAEHHNEMTFVVNELAAEADRQRHRSCGCDDCYRRRVR